MDAARYFELMHTAMSAQKSRMTLLLTVKVQDLGGADAYLELRQNPADGSARVLYSTMGRRNLNFQLFRKGWQPQCQRRDDQPLPLPRGGAAGRR